MSEFELYVPLVRGQRRRFNRLKRELVARFGGVTHFPQRNKGVWKIGTTEFRDSIVILRVLARESAEGMVYWRALKKRLQAQWKQKDILITVRRVKTL